MSAASFRDPGGHIWEIAHSLPRAESAASPGSNVGTDVRGTEVGTEVPAVDKSRASRAAPNWLRAVTRPDPTLRHSATPPDLGLRGSSAVPSLSAEGTAVNRGQAVVGRDALARPTTTSFTRTRVAPSTCVASLPRRRGWSTRDRGEGRPSACPAPRRTTLGSRSAAPGTARRSPGRHDTPLHAAPHSHPKPRTLPMSWRALQITVSASAPSGHATLHRGS